MDTQKARKIINLHTDPKVADDRGGFSYDLESSLKSGLMSYTAIAVVPPTAHAEFLRPRATAVVPHTLHAELFPPTAHAELFPDISDAELFPNTATAKDFEGKMASSACTSIPTAQLAEDGDTPANTLLQTLSAVCNKLTAGKGSVKSTYFGSKFSISKGVVVNNIHTLMLEIPLTNKDLPSIKRRKVVTICVNLRETALGSGNYTFADDSVYKGLDSDSAHNEKAWSKFIDKYAKALKL